MLKISENVIELVQNPFGNYAVTEVIIVSALIFYYRYLYFKSRTGTSKYVCQYFRS